MEEAATIGTARTWIWTGLRTGGSGTEIKVVAAVVVLLSIVPVRLAQRLTSGADGRAGAEEPVVLAPAATGSQPV